MKPLGIDISAGLRVVRPTTVEDAIWNAVREAINNDVSPQEFKREAADAWEECLRDDAKYARRDLER